MDKNTITIHQKKRRYEFKKLAIRSLKSYTSCSLAKKYMKELKSSGYKEWNNDYYAMIAQGKKIKSLKIDEFRVFVQAIYGWMPVLYSQQSIETLRNNLLTILSGGDFSLKIIDDSARCFTSRKHSAGSISAFSKVLHFCNPAKFPVWDTRVAKTLGRMSGTGNNIDVYLDYLSVMSDLKSDKNLSDFYEAYKAVIDHRATRLRAFEHGLFLKKV